MIDNPVRLAQQPVTVIHDDKTKPKSENHPYGSEAAGVTEAHLGNDAYKTYKITLFYKHCMQVYQESMLDGIVPYETFVFAVLVHEISHVLAGSFDIDWTASIPKNDMTCYLENVLEDARAEYRLMRDYPRYAPYVQVTLAAYCYRFVNPKLAGTSLVTDLNSIYYLTRFGVIVDGADEQLMNVALPLVISSTRGDKQNELVAFSTLYYYLMLKYHGSQEEKNLQSDKGVYMSALNEKEASMVAASQQVIANPNMDALNKVQSAKLGQDVEVPGASGPPPQDEERDESFYAATVHGNSDVITSLKTMFIKQKHRHRRQRAYDGDFYMKRQQDAYADSIMGEQGKNAVIWKRVLPSLQVAVLYDISGSTTSFKEQYAAAVVCILAALEGEQGVETACIEFNAYPRQIMAFGDRVSKTKFFPKAEGGTCLMPALSLAFGGFGYEEDTWDVVQLPGYNWTARDKHLVIVSDGDIHDWGEAYPRIEEIRETMGVSVLLVNIAPGARDAGSARNAPWAMTCELSQLPEAVMTHLL